MLALISHNDLIENVFSKHGIPTKVLFPDPQSDEPVEVIFPMGKEYEVAKVVRSAWQELSQLAPPPAAILPRTILYHLATELFGPLPIGTDSFISTNITNLRNPRVSLTTQTDNSWQAIPSQAALPSWQAEVYAYDVDLVFVATDVRVFNELESRALAATQQFNACSRFLKIDELRRATSSQRLVSPGALKWSVVQPKGSVGV